MFAQWVAAGAQIGVTAFFALFVFAAFVVAFLALMALVSSLFRTESNKDDMDRD